MLLLLLLLLFCTDAILYKHVLSNIDLNIVVSWVALLVKRIE